MYEFQLSGHFCAVFETFLGALGNLKNLFLYKILKFITIWE
jgi:hypothetical protein